MFSNKNKYAASLLLGFLGTVSFVVIPSSAYSSLVNNFLLEFIAEVSLLIISLGLIDYGNSVLVKIYPKEVAKTIRWTYKIGMAITIIVVGIFIFIRRDIAAILGVLLSIILIAIIYIKY